MIAIAVSLVLLGAILGTMHRLRRRMLTSTYLTPLNTPRGLGCGLDAERVRRGLDYLGGRKLIIAGLVRDSVGNVPQMKRNVARLGSIFKDWVMLVVENDSKDGTRTASSSGPRRSLALPCWDAGRMPTRAS